MGREENWKPRYGQKYWTLYVHKEYFFVCDEIWRGNRDDFDARNLGNCFRTDKEASVMLEKIRELLS